MTGVHRRALIFRLGEVLFLLELAHVVEVVGAAEKTLDSSRSDIRHGIVSALRFRNTWIPVVDPTLKLDIGSTVHMDAKVAIVLLGSEGNWALLVDAVSELSQVGNFKPCEIPFLLKVSATGFYSRVELLNDQPVVVFEPEQYYGSLDGCS